MTVRSELNNPDAFLTENPEICLKIEDTNFYNLFSFFLGKLTSATILELFFCLHFIHFSVKKAKSSCLDNRRRCSVKKPNLVYLELKALFSKSLKNPDIYGKLAYKKNVQIIKS